MGSSEYSHSDWVTWEYSHKKLEHLTVTQKELLRKREQLRKALVADLPDTNASDWRFVVVVGPVGTGKTAFIRDQLERLGYPELARKAKDAAAAPAAAATPFAAVTASARPTPYVLTKHQVILFDSMGTQPTFDLVRVEAAAADTLLVLLGPNGQIDQTHADACLTAWRLHHHMTTAFVLPKGDLLLAQDRGTATLPDFLAATKLRVAQALHRRLATHVKQRAAQLEVRLAADVHLFLQRAALEEPLKWAAMMLLEPWIHVHAYSCNDDEARPRSRSSSRATDVTELLRAEACNVQALAFGACGGAVAAAVAGVAGVKLSEPAGASSKAASGKGADNTRKDVPMVPARSVRAQCHEILVTELNNSRAQASIYQKALLPFLEAKATHDKGSVLPLEWAVLLSSSNPNLNDTAVSYIKSFTTDTTMNHTVIVEAGALRPLVILLAAHGRPTVQANAAGALRNLAAHPPNRTLIADAGAVRPLIDVLSGAPNVVERASHALAHLAQEEQNRNLIAEAGAIPPLVWLLSAGGMAAGSRAQSHAACTLRHLAAYPQHAAAIQRAGAITPLIALVSHGKHDAQEHAVGCLKNLACNEEAQREISRQGGIKPIVALIDASSAGIVTGVTLGALEEAAGALHQLARNNSVNRVSIAKECGIKPLVQLLGVHDPVLQAEAAGALWELGRDDENERAIAEAGAIPRLVEMIRGHDKQVHYDAVGALYVLSFHENHRAVIEKCGGIPPLVRLLDSDNLRVKEFAANTLGHLAEYKRAFRKNIVEEGAGHGLRRLTRCDSTTVQQVAMGALRKLHLNNN